MTRRRGMLLLAAVAGLIGGGGWLPLGAAPLLPLSITFATLGLARAESMRDATWFALVYGTVRYAVASHFLLALLRYSPLAVVFWLLAILYIWPFAWIEAAGGLWIERRTGLPRGLGLAILYTIGEYLRRLGDLSFPADPVAHAFGRTPSFLAWSAFAGPHVVTLMLTITGWLLAQAWLTRRSPRRAGAWLALACAAWFGPSVSDVLISSRAETGPAFRVGIVQPFATVEEKHDRRSSPRLWRRLEGLSRKAARGDVDLVLWPESARPGWITWRASEPFDDPEVRRIAREIETPILYGAQIARVEDGRPVALYNGAALVFPDERPARWYGKQHLLPFVEGVPFAKLIGWDPAKRKRPARPSYLTMMGNFSPGPVPTIFEVGPARIGVLICYEGFYPGLARRYRLAGANMLAVLTNDAWWGHSLFPRWHALMVASRAREIDVPIARAANNGISSVTDQRGHLVASTRLDEVTTLDVPITPATSPPTFYARTGDWLIGLLVLLLAGLLVISRLRQLRPPRLRSS